MSRTAQELETPQEEQTQTVGPGNIHALLADLQEKMEKSLREQFAGVERAVAKSLSDRMASADALIARLSTENARLEQENAKHQRTLERLRELALSDER